MYKNSIQKIGGLSVVHPARKKLWYRHLFTCLWPHQTEKHCGTALERWRNPDPPLWAFDVNMPPLLFTSCHMAPHLYYIGVLKRYLMNWSKQQWPHAKPGVHNLDYLINGHSDEPVIELENCDQFQTLVHVLCSQNVHTVIHLEPRLHLVPPPAQEFGEVVVLVSLMHEGSCDTTCTSIQILQ